MTLTDTGTVQIRANHQSVKRLGDWTTARRFDVRAHRGLIVLDLMLPSIGPGEIEITLDIDHGTVKLLVADGAIIDDAELRRIGLGRVKDWTGSPAARGRRIKLAGEMRNAEVRVHRGGVAIFSLLRDRGTRTELRKAHHQRKERSVDTEALIKHLACEVDDAYNNADAATMASYWTEDGLNINPFGDRFEGRADIEADLREGLDGFMKGSQHRLDVSHVVTLDGRTAVADGTATITGIVGFDGSTMEPLASDFSMICIRDHGGDWRIAQMRAYRFIPKHG